MSTNYEIKRLSYQIRRIEENDLESLLLVKNDASVHIDRLQQQRNNKVIYIGAFINNCAVGYVLLSLDNKQDVMPYTNNQQCADMIDLLLIKPLRSYGIGTKLVLECERYCKEQRIHYLGLDVNPTDNANAKRLYERLGYNEVGQIHLDGIYEYEDEQGNHGQYEDWCVDMIKKL